jgi:NADH-quinone oxidoreductase subunit C
MTEQELNLPQRLKKALAKRVLSVTEQGGQYTLEVAPDQWLEVARILRDDQFLRFTQLTSLCGVDYLSYGEDEWSTEQVTGQGFSRGVAGSGGPGRFDWEQRPEIDMQRRFAVVMHLLSITHNQRLRVKCFASDSNFPVIASLVDVWAVANWYERECFDLYGIIFEGHPDLRRLLTDYGFVGHPFRKDFPLVGNVEMRYDAEKQRVVYQPVTIEPRVLVPKVLRRDSRYLAEESPAPSSDGDSNV